MATRIYTYIYIYIYNYNTLGLFFTMFPLYLERVLFTDTEHGAPHCHVAFGFFNKKYIKTLKYDGGNISKDSVLKLQFPKSIT